MLASVAPVSAWAVQGQPQLWLRPERRLNSQGPGTVAAILRLREQPSILCALTAGHVLSAGADIERGALVDFTLLTRDTEPASCTGRAMRWSPMAHDATSGAGAEVDAALIELTADSLAPWVESMDWPRGWGHASVGEPLRLLTRQHRLPAKVIGRLPRVEMSLRQPPLSYALHDVWDIEVETGSLPGDSGAAYWNAADQIVALHVGSWSGGLHRGLALPISRVLEWARAVPVLRGEALQPNARDGLEPTSLEALDDSADPAAADTLARTMWGEARGEPDAAAGMSAVAHVVLNRRDSPSWWGRSVIGVCRHPRQFSCWNAGDPNLPRLRAVTAANALFAQALQIAQALIGMNPDHRGRIDPTGGATHYHAVGIPQPDWAQGQAPLTRIGNHVFYRDIG